VDCRPFDRLFFVLTDGRIFSRIICKGGGDGWKNVLVGRRNDENGIGSEMTDPKNETLAIHFDDKRGSNVRAAPDQYLEIQKYFKRMNDIECGRTHPATSSGHDVMILRASSCCRESSFTLSDFKRLARILL
jgi:hypothetical protein